ncbi:hypothetical protein [Natronobacterium gregoryi]|uniref:Uncharacterized protein n=2 Tax=Natronobacterium gregoryi TaxID=44930 RepID=L0AJB4_NATGS|nr:hypothetical protein [Natronobacterium gregoryi]AFZ73539.1 hypothetical protein Natgr_2367 [Natronobacterium gregoryi SP2]ELY68206.1 hypothetical protein C490_09985 [Natronobacterium gregoryi SP2]PLK20560.1 hypothetical protein CYV19_08950 [Natronobacterium gregoryi SP2]SFJ17170.1 hypothetical protein SAMN05443661_11642 [Natronobacterium gregoryi]
MEPRPLAALAFLVVLALFASVPFAGSLTPAYESEEFVGVAADGIDYTGEIDDDEPRALEELSPTARELVHEAESRPVEEPAGMQGEWHVNRVGVCRDEVLFCDGVEEWPADFDSQHANGLEPLHSKATAYYHLLEDGDEQLVVQTRSQQGGFLEPYAAGILSKTISFVPYGIFLLGATIASRRSQPTAVAGATGIGAILVLWGLAFPYLQQYPGIPPDTQTLGIVTASWLSIAGIGTILVGRWLRRRSRTKSDGTLE